MATKLKFPYTMHCPKCRAGLKIKSPKMVGTMISCPKCKKRIEVVTPDDDPMINYGVEAAPEPEKPPEPTEEELLEKAVQEKRKKRKNVLLGVWFWITVIVLIGGIIGTAYVIYNYAWIPFQNEDFSSPQQEGLSVPSEFNQ